MNVLTKSLLIGVAAAGLVLLWDTLSSTGRKKLHSVRIVVEATPKPTSSFTEEEVMKLTEKALRDRMKIIGYSHTIKRMSSRSLEIAIKHVEDTAVANRLFGNNAKIEFWEMYTMEAMGLFFVSADTIAVKYLNPAIKKPAVQKPEDTSGPLKRFSAEDNGLAPEGGEQKRLYSIIQFLSQPYTNGNGRQIYPAALGYVYAKDTGLLNKILSAAGGSVPRGAKFYYGPAERSSKEALPLYAINTKGRLTAPLGNEDIAKASAQFDHTGNASISLEFTPGASIRWANLTEQNINRPIAIVVNDLVISAPNVNSRIDGGRAQISGGFTLEEARTLAGGLSSPRYPAELKLISQEIVKENALFQLRTLLLALAGLVIGTGVAYLIFKMLKTS